MRLLRFFRLSDSFCYVDPASQTPGEQPVPGHALPRDAHVEAHRGYGFSPWIVPWGASRTSDPHDYRHY